MMKHSANRRKRLRRQPCSRQRTKGSGELDCGDGIRQPTCPAKSVVFYSGCSRGCQRTQPI